MATEPEFDEQDVDDSVFDELLTGGETLPMLDEQQDAYQQLSNFFNNARQQ